MESDSKPRLGAPLPAEVLALRDRLPRKPAPIDVTGTRCRLRPLEIERDLDALYAVSCGEPVRVGTRRVDRYDADALVWRYMSGGPFEDSAALGRWLRGQVDAPDGLALTVIDVASAQPVGVVNYLANQPEHLKIELGSIWYGPVAQGSGANTEVTYLLLRHAFTLGYRRIEWKCDALNERSRRAALGLGFTFEGIQDAHYIVKGRNRDTAWFRMLDRDWPAIERRLVAAPSGG